MLNKIHIMVSLLLFFSISCSKSNQESKPTNNDNIVSWNLSSIEVGNLDFGLVSFDKQKILTINILNDGEEDIQTPLTLSSADFQLAYNGCLSLSVGEKCYIKVLFNAKNKPLNSYSSNLVFGDSINIITAQIDRSAEKIESVFLNNGLPVLDYSFGTIEYSHLLLKSFFIKNTGTLNRSENVGIQGPDFSLAYDACSGKVIKPQEKCLVKVLISGQGKSGLLNNSLFYGSDTLPLSVSVKTKEQVAQENSDFVFIYNNQEVTGPIDLGTLNLNSIKEFKFYIKNIGTRGGRVVDSSFVDKFNNVQNLCSNVFLNPNQLCSIRAYLSNTSKGSFSTSITSDVEYQTNSQSIQWTIREPNDKIDCSQNIDNALQAEITWTGSAYTPCELISCAENFHKVSNICEADVLSCVDELGSGLKHWNGNDFDACEYSSCNSNYYLSGNSCLAQICSPNQPSSCDITGGSASRLCNSEGSGYGSCNLISCNSGFYQTGNSCTVQVCSPSSSQSCFISNGSGSQTCNLEGSAYGSCIRTGCDGGYHANGNSCEENVIACSDSLGTGTQTWNGSSYGSCQYATCNSGYYLSGASCLPQVCTPNSVGSCSTGIVGEEGTRTCNLQGSAYGSCTYSSCSAGYFRNQANTQCVLVEASGGNVVTSGDYKIHTFNSSSNFTISSLSSSVTIEYLIVAGGGAGGVMGGGGAGGFRTESAYSLTSNQTLPVVVGLGGLAGLTNGVGNSGQNSSFAGIVSAGGGGGGASYYNASQLNSPKNGGSGGGGSGLDAVTEPGNGNIPKLNPIQGNDGGYGQGNASTQGAGGGGGGAALPVGTVKYDDNATLVAGGAQNVVTLTSTSGISVGDYILFGAGTTLNRTISAILNSTQVTISPIHGISSANTVLRTRIVTAGTTFPGAGGNAPSLTVGGNGGAGRSSSITGTSLFYAAGGGAGSYNYNTAGTAGVGGSSIGGNGGRHGLAATSGQANTGSGGGATGLNSSGNVNGTNGAGGSGVVIIKYKYK